MSDLLPLQFSSKRDALLVASIVAVPAALLSCPLVLEGWSLLGDAVSHDVPAGVVDAYLLGIPLAVGASAAGMTCALTAGWLQARSRIEQGIVMSVVFPGVFAWGIVMVTRIHTDLHLDPILCGDRLGVVPADRW